MRWPSCNIHITHTQLYSIGYCTVLSYNCTALLMTKICYFENHFNKQYPILYINTVLWQQARRNTVYSIPGGADVVRFWRVLCGVALTGVTVNGGWAAATAAAAGRTAQGGARDVGRDTRQGWEETVIKNNKYIPCKMKFSISHTLYYEVYMSHQTRVIWSVIWCVIWCVTMRRSKTCVIARDSLILL